MKILIVEDQKALDQCLAIRREVFVKEQGVAEHLEVDEYDQSPDTCHFLLVGEAGEAIGAARMKQFEPGSAKMQRIAVLCKDRGKGYGSFLLQAMEEQAELNHFQFAILDAQVQAVPFYEKQGYTVISDAPFEDAGIEHLRMKKRLNPR